jgi:hypothetical protein
MDSDAQGERGLDNALPWAEVAAASFDSWTDQAPNYSHLQARHESRYRSNRSFNLLIEELNTLRDARAQQDVSLMETRRKQEIEERSSNRDEREELLRKAFGAGDTDEDADLPDIILEETANVLSDVIAASRG